jgi:hypothetical protein
MTKRYFEKGVPNDGNGGGRPQGARNRLSTAFLNDLLADWSEHGAGAIKIMRIERPSEYVKCVCSILPKEFALETNNLADVSDEDIAVLLATLQRMKLKRTEEAADEPTAH